MCQSLHGRIKETVVSVLTAFLTICNGQHLLLVAGKDRGGHAPGYFRNLPLACVVLSSPTCLAYSKHMTIMPAAVNKRQVVLLVIM